MQDTKDLDRDVPHTDYELDPFWVCDEDGNPIFVYFQDDKWGWL